MDFRSGLPAATINSGISVLGFSGGYYGDYIFHVKDNSIKIAIKKQLGRKLIDESKHSDSIYSYVYLEHKPEISSSRILSKGKEIWSSERGGKVIKTWCQKAVKLDLVNKNVKILPYVIKWCVMTQTVKHKLLDSGKKLISAFEDSKTKDQYSSTNYKKFKSETTFKKIVLKNKTPAESEGKQRLMNWCLFILKEYSDNSENSESYNNAAKWCVI